MTNEKFTGILVLREQSENLQKKLLFFIEKKASFKDLVPIYKEIRELHRESIKIR